MKEALSTGQGQAGIVLHINSIAGFQNGGENQKGGYEAGGAFSISSV
jgi:hypothetical protein|tara:strand:- start:19 stop:159 length:141 start_codon:yes stop_codon:yes gene_type:complete